MRHRLPLVLSKNISLSPDFFSDLTQTSWKAEFDATRRLLKIVSKITFFPVIFPWPWKEFFSPWVSHLVVMVKLACLHECNSYVGRDFTSGRSNRAGLVELEGKTNDW